MIQECYCRTGSNLCTFATLPKKPNSRDCNDYRTTSLMSHFSKSCSREYRKNAKKKKKNQVNNSSDLKTVLVLEKLFVL